MHAGISVVFFSFVLMLPAQASAAWGVRYFCNRGGVNLFDAGGYPHVICYDQGGALIDHKWTGVAWATATVDASGTSGNIKGAADGLGNLYVAYTAGGSWDLKYAKWDGASWSSESVPGATGMKGVGIAVDASGYPHVAGDSSYSYWDGGAWNTLASPGDWYPSIGLDASGYPHITYYNSAAVTLGYAKWDGSTWSAQVIDSGHLSYWGSLIMMAGGIPRIYYTACAAQDAGYVCTAGNLKEAVWSGVSWSTQTVDSGFGVVFAGKNSGGDPVAAYKGSDGSVNYAEWTGVAWSTQPVVTSASPVSLALDPGDHPAIFFSETGTSFSLARMTSAPVLAWTGESNYSSGGIYPETGDAATERVFRVKYTDADNDPPYPYRPTLYILKNGATVQSDVMDYVSGSYNTGAIYSFSCKLSDPMGSYSYHFAATDPWNVAASGAPAAIAPLVTPSRVLQKGGRITVGNNLFSPGAGAPSRIWADVPSAGKVSLKIYTLSGRHVVTLYDGFSGAGTVSGEWDGRSKDGVVAAPGVYLLNFTFPGGSETRKIGVKR